MTCANIFPTSSHHSWVGQSRDISSNHIEYPSGPYLNDLYYKILEFFDPLPLIYISRYFSHYSPSVRSWTSSKYGPNFSLALSLPPSLRWHMATSSRAGGLSKHKIQIPLTKYLKLTTKGGGACCYLRWVATGCDVKAHLTCQFLYFLLGLFWHNEPGFMEFILWEENGMSNRGRRLVSIICVRAETVWTCSL